MTVGIFCPSCSFYSTLLLDCTLSKKDVVVGPMLNFWDIFHQYILVRLLFLDLCTRPSIGFHHRHPRPMDGIKLVPVIPERPSDALLFQFDSFARRVIPAISRYPEHISRRVVIRVAGKNIHTEMQAILKGFFVAGDGDPIMVDGKEHVCTRHPGAVRISPCSTVHRGVCPSGNLLNNLR